MPTNEERHEVAERLRQEANTNNWQDLVILDYPIARALKEQATDTDDDRFEKRLLLKLADLIEPEPERTCHAVKISMKDLGEGFVGSDDACYTCSICNELLVNFDFDQKPPKPIGYCPNCGAKVIDDGN